MMTWQSPLSVFSVNVRGWKGSPNGINEFFGILT